MFSETKINRNKSNKVCSKVLYTFFYCRGTKCQLAIAIAKSLQSCPTLCDPIDGSPPGFPVPRILQARILEWGAIAWRNTNLLTYSSIESWIDMAGFFSNGTNKAKIKVSARWDFCLESLKENSSTSPFLFSEFGSLWL